MPEDRSCLDEFDALRTQWAHTIGLNVRRGELPHYFVENAEEYDTHELLITEVGLKLTWFIFRILQLESVLIKYFEPLLLFMVGG